MSRTIEKQTWGPQDQQLQPAPAKPRTFWKLLGWFLFAMYLHGVVDAGGSNPVFWSVQMVVLGWVATMFVRGVRDGRIPVQWLLRLVEEVSWGLAGLFGRNAPSGVVARRERGRAELSAGTTSEPSAEDVRGYVDWLGGGAYLGVDEDGRWVTAERESAVMVLGPPRSGKTAAVMIPALLGAPGAAVCTSTKPDVMQATMRARGELGQLWLFDPAGEEHELPAGVRRLRWSPVAAASSWDQALIMARAMTACTRVGAGTTNENHWTERAAALLAPLLYAAHLTGRPIEEVLRWTVRQDVTPAREALADADSEIAADVLAGIERTDSRERSSIFSATSGVLSAYHADATRATASDPNFDPVRFAASCDTVYITAPEEMQALCAPLIVGLLEQIRRATYRQARTHGGERTAMTWLLDEVANIAPIHDLPALVSQAGGQSLQVIIGLQDLSQARTRWGESAADGFMSLFQTRLILSGIGDSRTLESISLSLGEYDRELIATSSGTSESADWFSPQGRSENVSYHTQRQRTLTPGDIARLPDNHGLLLHGAAWELIGLTRWYESEPWASIAGAPR